MEEVLGILGMVSLMVGMVAVSIQRIWGGFSTKDYFLTARATVIVSVACSLLFKGDALGVSYLATNSQTLWIYVFTSGIVYIWLSLSLKWFVTKDLPSCLFCFLALVGLLSCRVLSSTENLMIMFASLAVLMLINFLFLYLSQQTEELHNISSRYGLSALLFIMLAGAALYILSPAGWNLAWAAEISSGFGLLESYVVIAGFLFVFIFALAVAPLHFWFADATAPAVLPVAAYFSLVPVLPLWTAFIKLHHQFLQPLMHNIDDLYILFGILSILAGAIGANTSRNLRRIFAGSGIFHFGVMMLALAVLPDEALFSGAKYIQIYLLTMTGIYTVFYSFKSRGDYLYNLNMVGGFAKVRPFVAGTMLFFMASLVGLAPLPGFYGIWSALKNFADVRCYGLMAAMLGCLMFLIPAFLQVVRAVCFSPRKDNFDRTENNIYVYLVLITAFMLLLICQPRFLHIL